MSDPFETCPSCGAGEGWCEDGCCIHCEYDVFEDSDIVEDGEDAHCPECGEPVEDEYCEECGGVWA
jgi:hypothetical protein